MMYRYLAKIPTNFQVSLKICSIIIFVFFAQASSVTSGHPFYYFTVFLIFFNVTVNPFIYATKHDAVRNQLMLWLGRRTESSDATQSQIDGKTRSGPPPVE